MQLKGMEVGEGIVVDDMAIQQTLEKFHLHTLEDVLDLPEPVWLIAGLFPKRSQVVLFGPRGEGKSFLALDWALHIASGTEWQGRKVHQGEVIYVVAEGIGGISLRVGAWTQEHPAIVDPNQAFFILEAVQLRAGRDVEVLLRRIEEKSLEPALVVFDTFSRCFVGGDENAAQDVGIAIDAMAGIQSRTGATVMMVHHSGKGDQDIERGSSALGGAADVMILLRQKKTGTLIIRNTKQKDAEEFQKMVVQLKQVALANDDGEEEVTSLVLAEGDGVKPEREVDERLSEGERLALSVLVEGATSGEWRRAIQGAQQERDVPQRTFQNWRKALVDKRLVELVPGERRRYRLTQEGRATTNDTQPEAA